ncbi:ParB/RepB/Spo0J family partition protein [uncultured Salinisphaera sp.]|uniref:ParB/RepB/Spo0J family partition protein n=1 Tax=uncultured Salinisphaera sp. TaxID=359372 RepID=UPI0032B1FE62|tara:strand:+ start:1957 stop:2820 length:864 start_codon:yes stop_codon:yes gene_type:complete
MAQKKRGLGRGLESLLSKDFDDTPAAAELVELALDDLAPGRYQPRRDMDADALEALAQSIQAQGVVQPLVVRRVSDTAHDYEIIAGERRWRAARLAGLSHVPAVVREFAEEAAMAVALIENIQREDLNPLEVSGALKRLIDECGFTHAQCAAAVGRSRAAVSNLLRLSDLVPEVAERLRVGELEMGHARALLGLDGDTQAKIAARVVERGLTVRQTEALVRAAHEGTGKQKTQHKPARDERLQRHESSLSQRLAAGVKIEPDRRGGGKVVIRYQNVAELDALVDRFN